MTPPSKTSPGEAEIARNPETMLVSIVITNFNYAEFVGAAIESALSQVHPAVEVIVVDDGSVDDSRTVIRTYGDRVACVFQDNAGMGGAINAGFAASSGDVVIFLDSDDELAPTAAGAAASALASGDAVKAHWPLAVMDANGAVTEKMIPSEPLPEGDIRGAMIDNGPMAGDGPPTSGNAWTRKFLATVLPIPEHALRQHADAYLNTLAPLSGRVRAIPSQGRYRVHSMNDDARRPLIDRLRRNVERYHYRCRLQSRHLRQSGTRIPPDRWKVTDRSSYYGRVVDDLCTIQLIESVVPLGATFVIVDEGAFSSHTIVENRLAVRFPGSDATPPSTPSDDAIAIEQLEQLRADGAEFLFICKSALAWLQRYPAFMAYLNTHYTPELSTAGLTAFYLATRTLPDHMPREVAG